MARVPLSIVLIFILAAVYVVIGSSLTSNRNIVDGKLEIFRRREEELTRYVYKRAAIGKIFAENAIKRILIGAKPLYSNGLDTYYMKPGGHAKAVTDFESLKPEKFKTKTLKGTIVHMKGNVGNRDVIFRRDMSTDTAIIIMTQPRCRVKQQQLGRRKKATYAEIGISGLNKILKGAKFVYSDGLASVFTKTGGYSQAAKDFKKVKPTKVKGKQPKSGMEQMVGHFGNRRIILQKDPTLEQTKVIVKRQPVGFGTEAKHDLNGDQIFIYPEIP